MYYVGGKTQDEIAKTLNTSRQSAQRLVALSMSEGLVKVRLEHPIARCMELAQSIKEKFGLTFCEVVPNVDDDLPRRTYEIHHCLEVVLHLRLGVRHGARRARDSSK